MSLAAKLACIGKEVGSVDKTGNNVTQRYDYIEYGVVAGRIRELFEKYKIIIVPNVEEYSVDEITGQKGGKGYHYNLRMRFVVINGDDTSDKIEAKWMGESADYGDKGINKAETAGTKYFLMRLLNISEKGEKDPDGDSPNIKQTKPQKTIENGVNFRLVREHLPEIESIDELNKYWFELKLTQKQANILKTDFAKRKEELGGQDGVE